MKILLPVLSFIAGLWLAGCAAETGCGDAAAYYNLGCEPGVAMETLRPAEWTAALEVFASVHGPIEGEIAPAIVHAIDRNTWKRTIGSDYTYGVTFRGEAIWVDADVASESPALMGLVYAHEAYHWILGEELGDGDGRHTDPGFQMLRDRYSR